MELQILQQILDELKEVKSGQQKLKADIADMKTDIAGMKTDIADLKADNANIRKDTARIPYVEQAILELSQDEQNMQEKLQKNEAILDVLSIRKLS